MPEQELTDLHVRGEDIFVNEVGDLDLIRGFDNVLQSVALDVRDIIHFEIGNQITIDNIYAIQDAINRSLLNDPQVTNPISVTPTQINEEANELTFTVTTHDNEEFTLDLVLPE